MTLIWSILAGAIITGCVAAEPDKEPGKVKIRTLAKGGFSGIQEPLQVAITNETQWADLWRKHSVQTPSGQAAPKIDWSKETVLFVGIGQKRSGGHTVEITEVQRGNGKTEVIMKTKNPKPGGLQIQALTAPFHIAAVPKITGPVKFKQDSKP